MEHKQIILGDYVLTPCKNAFNDNISYWISKKDCMISIYAFTPTSRIDLDTMTTEGMLKGYVDMYKDILENLKIRGVYCE